MSSFSFKRQVVKRFYNTSPRNPLNSVKCSLFSKSTFRNRKVLVALRKHSVQFTLQLVRCLSDHLEGKLPWPGESLKPYGGKETACPPKSCSPHHTSQGTSGKQSWAQKGCSLDVLQRNTALPPWQWSLRSSMRQNGLHLVVILENCSTALWFTPKSRITTLLVLLMPLGLLKKRSIQRWSLLHAISCRYLKHNLSQTTYTLYSLSLYILFYQ